MGTVENSTKTSVRLMSICMQMGLHGGNRVVFNLVGKPGIAKTQGIYAVTAELTKALKKEFPAEVYSGPQVQAEDFSGLPVPDLEKGRTALLPLRIGDKVEAAGQGVVCIDEFGSLSPAQEAAALNFCQGGTLGERVLPNAIAIGVMMNPEHIASNGRGLGAAMSNRLVHINWELDPNAWYDYMLGGKGLAAHVEVLPKDWEEKYGSQTAGLVVSYIRRNPGQLLNVPDDHDTSMAWPSPRSWETAARLLAAVMSTGERKESDLAHMAIAGCVGEGAAEAFMDWMIKLNLPDPEELLKDPEKGLKKLPKRHDQRAVTLEAVAVAATQTHEKLAERWEKAWAIVGPAFIEENDVGIQAAKILSKVIPPGAKRPPETKQVFEILKNAGLMSA